MKQKIIDISCFSKHIKISNTMPIVLIAGPCVIESKKQAESIASSLKLISADFDIPLIFKASYDKANRTSINSFRGLGIKEGLKILSFIKEKYELPILTDVHCVQEIDDVAKVADVIQIPAFLCRQTDLLVTCAKTNLPVNIKKGQFLAPDEVINIINKIKSTGNNKILLTERGTSFGYHNLVVDMRSLEIMKKTGCPVIFDATHSVQIPGGLGGTSGGQREFIFPLARAAVAVGVAGIFFEVHTNPDKALSDGPNSLSLKDLPEMLSMLKKLDVCF